MTGIDLDSIGALARGARLYLRPVGLLPRVPGTRRLAGGPVTVERCTLIVRGDAGTAAATAPVDDLVAWARRQDPAVQERFDALLARLTAPRPDFAGLPLDRPRLMGIVNVTPDSFSDGGAFLDAGRAADHALALHAAGADIIDLGAESTRPGALPVEPAVQIARLLPVIERVAPAGVVLSVDTRSAAVMEAALEAGAKIVNDVSGLAHDPGSVGVVARSGAAAVLMHMRGVPETMNRRPDYADLVLDVFDELETRLAACAAAGIPAGRLLVDPGIGFAKHMEHNIRLLGWLSLFHGLGCGILLGVSRKGLLARWADDVPPAGRLPGSLAAALAGLGQGVQVLRVHDVAETAQARDVWEAVAAA